VGIRETLNRNPILTIAGTLVVLVLAAIFIVRGLMPPKLPPASSKWFYTEDDGASYFEDEKQLILPYKRDSGKDAVRAHIFLCADGTKMVGYLERYSPELKNALTPYVGEADWQTKYINPLHQLNEDSRGREVKKPGGKRWISSNETQAYLTATLVECKDGKPPVEEVQPK
jgi:hypothetical protein